MPLVMLDPVIAYSELEALAQTGVETRAAAARVGLPRRAAEELRREIGERLHDDEALAQRVRILVANARAALDEG